MAINTTVQIVRDGPRNAVVHLTGLSDGDDQENGVVKVDPTALNPPCDHFSVLAVRHTIDGGAVTLAWDAGTPVPFLQASGYNDLDEAYEFGGGLQPDVEGATDVTGSIVLTTVGFAPGSTYDIVLKLRKKY